ncbi:MAG: hypothetical protein OXD43_14775 [Bacteroidetes bacterium]|nr:hypothetical protein [Bacteroidota bacterium]
MTNLQELLTETGIRKAVVIDDAFDEIPQTDEIHAEDWSTFLDDLTEDDCERLSDLYFEFESADANSLLDSQDFIDILWKNRNEFSGEAITALFNDYETSNATERTRLRKIVQLLRNAGLACTGVGRNFIAKAREADLIVIDLFLGPWESHDLDRDIEQVHELVADRADNPPLIILTSSSHRLDEKRNDFRDEAGLLASTFRVASKSELIEAGRLELILSRLASHYGDAKRIAGFLDAWDKGLTNTRKTFLQQLRRLDLSDLAQIKTLILSSEGEHLGDYLLDVADRVLQHEIEGNAETIDATLKLNKIDLAKYPAPHLTGTPDLQDLVYRTVFMNDARLSLSEDNGTPHLRFGDVLRRKKGDEVYLVVTPACDLVRRGTKHIMLLPGKLEKLEPKDWSYKEIPVRTPILILSDGQQKWIKWNLRAVKTQSWDDLNDSLRQDGYLIRIARLRELYALTLQQKLLARMGRIGQRATLPASFPVTVSLFYVDNDKKACELKIDGIEPAACYIGRRGSSEQVHHLVLTEQICDQIRQALQQLPRKKVCSQARESLTAAIIDNIGFITKFERGEVEIPPEGKYKYIKSRDNRKTYAAIVRSNELEHGKTVKNTDARKAALIVKVLYEDSSTDTI